MENNFYNNITSSEELSRIFEGANDKLVILLFYTKHNGECKRAYAAIEKAALNHISTCFCVIDMDKFQGESRFVNSSINMPRIECFYSGNSIGSSQSSNDKEIENIVRAGEQYVMTQNNTKNNNINQNNIMTPNMNTPLNPMQLQQQILNHAQMTNPTQYQYLVQNPTILQQLVQKQMQYVQQQQSLLMQNQPLMMPANNPVQLPTAQPFVMQPTPAIQPVQTQQQQPLAMAHQLLQANQPASLVPTFQQMQQMFQIFQMMHQMGILNMQPIKSEQSSSVKTEQNVEPIILPNGDKLIPLADGKYGLIKKLNNNQ